MNQTAVQNLEFDNIKQRLKEYAQSDQARGLIEKLQPTTQLTVIANWLKETTEARMVVNKGSSVPLHGLMGVEQVMQKLGKGASLLPDDFTTLWGLLDSGKKLKKFMKEKEELAPQISAYAYSLCELDDLADEILRCIRNGRVDDQASKELAKLRRKIAAVETQIKSKLESLLRSSAYRDMIQEQVISIRDGRYVIPVKKEARKNIAGHVLDSSASGQTVFIEPEEVKKLQNECNMLKIDEEAEEQRILHYLTGMAESYRREISINIETMVHYDFIFAKGKYSKAIAGRSVEVNDRNFVKMIEARHPLLGESAVPLDFAVGERYQALVITGPNTGGKTVAIKTVGLLTMMVQAGLHVPVGEGSQFAVFRDLLVDIGDGQSIEQSLSTFSAHVRNLISILECAKPSTLVILDELGAGTDPQEGMGLAIAILEELHRKGATILATTHYSEIKEFAANRDQFENGSMEFDLETLRPLYRLSIGKAGESQAFAIALRLGINHKLIERAHQITYKEEKEYRPIPPATQSPVRNEEMIRHHRELAEQDIPKAAKNKPQQPEGKSQFSIGDRVFIKSLQTSGVIYELENYKDELGVMVKDKKLKVHKNQLKLQIESKKLYPENYDFDVIFLSKEARRQNRDGL